MWRPRCNPLGEKGNALAEPLAKGLRVLLLEDHDLVASAVTIGIAHAGHHTIGPFQSCHAAMAAPADYDAAILDISLPDGPPFAFAQHLMDRGLPFLFYTGSEPDDMPPALRAVPVLLKRNTARALLSVLEPLALARAALPIACP